jgi:hypothetical protein
VAGVAVEQDRHGHRRQIGTPPTGRQPDPTLRWPESSTPRWPESATLP